MYKPLKYIGYSIVFQEVPNEISLAINVSGCPHKCEGCHSQYLWEYKGAYLLDDMDKLLALYTNMITCVCFMGGDQNPYDLISCFQRVKEEGLKICLYSGEESLSRLSALNIAEYCDYIKTGSYKYQLGGLNNPKTNQHFYVKEETNGSIQTFRDITYVFQKNKEEAI